MYKAVIIGSGPAGYTAAIRIAQLGGKVAIVERDLIGGICVNWGCTPSKAMIASAKYAKYAKEMSKYGIDSDSKFVVDFSKIAARRDKVMQNTREEIRHLLDYWKVDVIQGRGEIIDPTHVKIVPYDNPNKVLSNIEYPTIKETITLETESIIIATGSAPLIPEFLQKEDPTIINSNRLISIKELPKELTIVGGGIIGLEFSAVFSHFGVKVRVIEFLDRILSLMDQEISAEITKELEEIGVEVLVGHKVLDITNGKIKVEIMATGEIKEIDSPLNLIAIGRKAIINNSELEKVGIEYTPKGIKVNDYLRTSIPNIYAVGDATGLSILAHVAIQQGLLAAENIMMGNSHGHSLRKMNYDVIPAVVYTLPEVATVGTVPTDLIGTKVVKFPFSANLRANIEEHNKGFVKMWIKEEDNTLLATQLIGDFAGEIIQAYANVVQQKTNIEVVANTIHAHPTYNEIVRNSFEYALGRAIEHV